MTRGQAKRLGLLPPYLFVAIDERKRAAIEAGRDVIDFGIGDPDRPTHGFILDRMAEAIGRPANHKYAQGAGGIAFRRAAAAFMQRRFGVEVDPGREVAAIIGSKEGIGHLPTALVDPGDIVLVPAPGYPVYTSGTIFAGGECYVMPLRAEHGWLPRLEDIPPDVRRRARLMYLNYPNNPTAAVAPLSFYEEAVAFAREYGILIAHDAAYSETYFNEPPPSLLQVKGSREVAIEFHSLSKTFNMTGWRIGFVVGQAEAIAALLKVKNNVDSGVFGAIQEAGIAALEGIDRPEIRQQIEMYRKRRDVLVDGLIAAGWSVERSPATFYVWAKCPGGGGSMAAATRILDETAVVVIPGIGFGEFGEGHVRFALTVDESRTREAVERISKMTW
jgi:LL-diaminopimelate aminotransferase